MPSSNSSTLLLRWQAGDAAAADEIFLAYRDRLCALARTRINKKLARRVDPDDITQSVFRSFFRRGQDGAFVADRSEALWRLLVGITLKKIDEKYRFHLAKRRSLKAEQSWTDDLPPEIIAHEPTPAEAAAAEGELEAVLEPLSDQRRQIVSLCLQGHSCSEIAAALGCSRWTPRRVLDEVGRQLRERFDADS